MNRRVGVLALGGVVLCTALFLFVRATAQGIGATPDSARYLAGARNLRAGLGFTAAGEPITRVPPAYSAVLAALGGLDAGILAAARWLHAVLYVLNVGLIGAAVATLAGRGGIAAVAAMGVVAASPGVLQVHATLWSEALFITEVLAFLVVLARFLASGGRIPALALAGVVAALAALTRYIGVALVPAGAIAILMVRDRSMSRRCRDAALFTALAIAPLGLWLVKNVMTTGGFTDRSLLAHPIGRGTFGAAVETLIDLAAPFAHGAGAAIVVAGLSVPAVLALVLVMRVPGTERTVEIRVLLPVVSLACYLAVLLVSMSWLDAATVPDVRILSPAFVLGVVWLGGIACAPLKAPAPPAAGAAALLGASLAVLALVDGPYQLAAARQMGAEGLGYSSVAWKSSDTIALLRTAGDDSSIYSNGEDAIYLLLGREAHAIPSTRDPLTGRANPLYGEQMSAMLRRMAGEDAMLVYFDRVDWRGYLPREDELRSWTVDGVPALVEVAASGDGRIYRRH